MIEFLDSVVHSHPSSYCPLNYVWVYFGACVCVFVCDCGTRICSQCKLFVRGEGKERHSTLLLSMQSSELSHYVPCPTCATCRYSFPLSVLYQLLNLLCIVCHVLVFICVVALLFLPWITRPVLVYTLLSYHCLEKKLQTANLGTQTDTKIALFLPPPFDDLQYANTKGERPGRYGHLS